MCYGPVSCVRVGRVTVRISKAVEVRWVAVVHGELR